MSIFTCCLKYCKPVIEDPIENALKKPLTFQTVIDVVDTIEENVIEQIIEPFVDKSALTLTGIDISGILQEVVKNDLEPLIENETNVLLEVAEKTVAESVIHEVESIVQTLPYCEVVKEELASIDVIVSSSVDK